MLDRIQKTIDLRDEFHYPLFERPSKHFQEIISCEIHYPFLYYELKFIPGITVYDWLLKNKDEVSDCIAFLGKFLDWFKENCLLESEIGKVMLNGDSHLGNVVVDKNGRFCMIDFMSDFLSFTENSQRPFMGIISSLKNLGLLQNEEVFEFLVSNGCSGEYIKKISELSGVEISDFSDSTILESRTDIIKKLVNNKDVSESKLLSILKSEIVTNYNLIEDFKTNFHQFELVDKFEL